MLTGLRFTMTTLAGQKDIGNVLLLQSGKVLIEINIPGLQQELESGVIGPDKKRYLPEDGQKFLQAALRQFSGSHIQAHAIRPSARAAGGPGSGNFGHGGRPGEVGGSSGDGSTENPHKSTHPVGTEITLERKGKTQTAKLVRKEHHGEEWRIHNEKGQYVYSEGFRYVTEHRTTDPEHTLTSILGPKAQRKRMTVDALNALSQDQLTRLDDAYTKLVEGAKTSNERLGHSATRDAIRSKLRGAGGPGSGNFGHAGRPGEIGGSSSEGDEGGKDWQSPGGFAHTGVTWSQPTDPKTGRPIPIKVKTVEEAAVLVQQGKVVEVPDVRSAYTLLDRLATMANEAKAAGKDAPMYDLCQVSVAGTNMFCAESLRNVTVGNKTYTEGVPRLEMPQLGGKPIAGSEADTLEKSKSGEVDGSQEFISFLRGIGMRTTREDVSAAKLKGSQRELRGPVVAGMMTNKNYDPSARPIFISSDDYVVDGHHRWAATVGRDAEDGRLGDSTMKVVRVNAPIAEVLHIAGEWSKRFGIQQAGMTVS